MSDKITPSSTGQAPRPETIGSNDVPPPSPGVVASLVQLHSVEYEALMTRATYFITIMATIWPLLILFLTLVIAAWKPTGVSMSMALSSLRSPGAERTVFVWGNLLVIHVMLIAWAQILLQQYTIVLYLESGLRQTIEKQELAGRFQFWNYERFLMRRLGTGSTWWELLPAIGLGTTILSLAYVLRPLSKGDYVGVCANTSASLLLFIISGLAIMTRRRWQNALQGPLPVKRVL
jgi:hypothetical protein